MITTDVSVKITSDGPVRLSAPAIAGIQYFNIPFWEDELNMTMRGIYEHGKNIYVRLRVAGGKPGNSSYKIPFTVNVI